PAFLGRGAVPFGQAIAAEPGEVHQVDVLHVGALAQMLYQATKSGRLELNAGLVVHVSAPLGSSRISREPPASRPSPYRPLPGAARACRRPRTALHYR